MTAPFVEYSGQHAELHDEAAHCVDRAIQTPLGMRAGIWIGVGTESAVLLGGGVGVARLTVAGSPIVLRTEELDDPHLLPYSRFSFRSPLAVWRQVIETCPTPEGSSWKAIAETDRRTNALECNP